MGPHPAVAAIRLAVRRVLHDVVTEYNRRTEQAGRAEFAEAGAGARRSGLPERPDTPLVLVACSNVSPRSLTSSAPA
ncbi:tRNA lysidine(34) synthetase TilS, partial [Streptomyces sp. FT05W]